MVGKLQKMVERSIVACFGILLATLVSSMSASAITPLPTPDPKPGSYGLEARKDKAPPTRGARITVPSNGASFTTSPITVSGTCPNDLLVQIYNNNVLVGAVMCKNGSFSIEVSLFSGKNALSAIVYDTLGQPGPKSNIVTVTYTDEHLSAFGQLLTLTSQYGRMASSVGTNLKWPIQLTGGTGPYALSIDWGDGSAPELMSRALAGVFNINHVYKKAGIYIVSIKATDKNGVSAFLQLIAVANGKADNSTITTDDNNVVTKQAQPKILWLPIFLLWLLLVPSYWLGRRSMRISIRNQMLRERDAYEKDDSGSKSSK